MNVDGTFSADERLGCTLVDAGTGGATYTIMVPLGTAPGTTVCVYWLTMQITVLPAWIRWLPADQLFIR